MVKPLETGELDVERRDGSARGPADANDSGTSDPSHDPLPPPARQLEAFEASLRERELLRLLLDLLGPLRANAQCLLLTHGARSGALHFHLRAAGGRWSWAELDPRGLEGISLLLGEQVAGVNASRLSFDDARFDRVVVIDAHPFLEDPGGFDHELARVLAPGGSAILVIGPGAPEGVASAPRVFAGRRRAHRSHVTAGAPAHRVTADELEARARAAGLVPFQRAACSRVFMKAWERLAGTPDGAPVPLRRLGSIAAQLDRLVPVGEGSISAVAARKPRRVARRIKDPARRFPRR